MLQQPPVEPPETLPDGYLSAHFTLAELIYSDTANARGIDNTPDTEALAQLSELARWRRSDRSAAVVLC